VWFQLRTTRTLTNVFGYQCKFLDRMDVQLRNQGLAWLPQSTVGNVTNFGLMNIYENLPPVELLLQVHDSLVMQVPRIYCPDIFDSIQHQMTIKCPYEDPLYIPVGLEVSDISWGHLVSVDEWKEKNGL